MATYEISPVHGTGAKLSRPVELVCFALLVLNVVYLAAAWAQGSWPTGADGKNIFNDFVTIWAAGKMALAGHAPQAYDWSQLKPVDETVVGPISGYLGWPYPPTFLLVASILALLPYISAFYVWVFGTFVAYVAVIRAIVGDRVGYFLAAAFPGVIANFMVGQTAFVSTALIGGTLTLMDTQPVWAGVMLGLLTYKPHFGLLFPIALAVSGRWKVFFTAGVVAALMATLSWTVFGAASWEAFAPGLGHALVADTAADWGKMQTTFGLVHTLGGSDTLAWSAQIAVAIACAGVIAVLWRSGAAYEIKAAALGAATLLATPHLLTYDLAVLAVPLAFLFRYGRAHGFLPYETAGMGLACLLILSFPFVEAQVCLAAILIVAAMIANRIRTAVPH
jgi:arabinofuranan 3-O-arabinosyltransferase